MPTPEELERLQRLEHPDPEPGLSVAQLAQANALTQQLLELTIEQSSNERERVKELTRLGIQLLSVIDTVVSGKLEPFDQDEVRKTLMRYQEWGIRHIARYGDIDVVKAHQDFRARRIIVRD